MTRILHKSSFPTWHYPTQHEMKSALQNTAHFQKSHAPRTECNHQTRELISVLKSDLTARIGHWRALCLQWCDNYSLLRLSIVFLILILVCIYYVCVYIWEANDQEEFFNLLGSSFLGIALKEHLAILFVPLWSTDFNVKTSPAEKLGKRATAPWCGKLHSYFH